MCFIIFYAVKEPGGDISFFNTKMRFAKFPQDKEEIIGRIQPRYEGIGQVFITGMTEVSEQNYDRWKHET